MNKIILLGRLTKDIELKETVSGKSYTRVGLAVDRPFSKNKEVDFFNLVAWDKTAEMMSRYFEKGRRILIEGRMQMNNYEKNGVKYNGYDVVVVSVYFADDKKKAASDDPFGGEPINNEDTPF